MPSYKGLATVTAKLNRHFWGSLSPWSPPFLSRGPWYGFMNTLGSRYPNCVLCLTWPFKCLSAPLSPSQLYNLALTEYVTPLCSGPLFPIYSAFCSKFQKKMFLSGKMAEKLPSEKQHKKQNKDPARKIKIGHN